MVGGWWIWGVLTKSSYYKDYGKFYNEKVASAQVVNQPQNLDNVINEIIKIIQSVKPDFNSNNIKFKNFDFENDDINGIGIVFFNNNIIYFSNKLGNSNIDRMKKFKMLETCCHFFKINAIDLLINSSQYFSN